MNIVKGKIFYFLFSNTGLNAKATELKDEIQESMLVFFFVV